MSSSTCVVWKPQLFIQWTGSCELPPTSSLGHCTFGDKLSLSLLSCLFRDTRARSLPNALSSLARSCQTPFPCQSLHPNTLSPLYPERVDCSEWPSHTRSCRLLLHFFWFLTMKDADGGLSMNSPHQQDLMSLQLVFIGLSLYGITLLHVLTWPTHTHPTSSPLLSEYDPQTLAIVHLIFLGLSVSPRVSDHCQPIRLTAEEITEQDSLLAASFYTTLLLG